MKFLVSALLLCLAFSVAHAQSVTPRLLTNDEIRAHLPNPMPSVSDRPPKIPSRLFDENGHPRPIPQPGSAPQ